MSDCSSCRCHCFYHLLCSVPCATFNHQSTECVPIINDSKTSCQRVLLHQWHSLLSRFNNQSNILSFILSKISSGVHSNNETAGPLSTAPASSPTDKEWEENSEYLSTATEEQDALSASYPSTRFSCSSSSVNLFI